MLYLGLDRGGRKYPCVLYMVSFKCKFCCKVQKWFLNGGGEGQTLVAAFAYDGKQNGFLLLIFHIWWGGLSPVTTEDGSQKFFGSF